MRRLGASVNFAFKDSKAVAQAASHTNSVALRVKLVKSKEILAN